jgi:hypothetical protein
MVKEIIPLDSNLKNINVKKNIRSWFFNSWCIDIYSTGQWSIYRIMSKF